MFGKLKNVAKKDSSISVFRNEIEAKAAAGINVDTSTPPNYNEVKENHSKKDKKQSYRGIGFDFSR